MKNPVFDTNIFIEYQLADADFRKMKVSAIVLYELTATTIDEQTRKFYDALKRDAADENILIVPEMSDFWETAKIVSRWRFEQKQQNGGKTPKLKCACEPQNDALIGYTAWRNNAFVVTNNVADFERFNRFWKVKTVSALEYFGY